MFPLYPTLLTRRVPDLGRRERVIELLRVHVEDVGVPLDGVVAGHNVEVAHSNRGVGVEDGGGGEEFVKVTGDHDMRGWVGGQDGFDECLTHILIIRIWYDGE